MSARHLDRFHWGVLVLAAALAGGLYFAAAALTFRAGFPLDDAWIHQTYARNLVQTGQWAFVPGQPSAGSTAPLWSALLAVGHWLRLPPLLWVWLLGWGTLVLLGGAGESAFRALVADYRPRWPWVGLLLVLEWHDIWAAFSGMETALYALGVFWVLTRLLLPRCGAASLGLVVGWLVWLRPDALTLVGPVLWTILLADIPRTPKMKQVTAFLLTLGVPVAFYALFNLLLDGAVLPNTFYAKQAEYLVLRQIPFWRRWLAQFSTPLIGAGLLLLPGWLWWLWQAVQRRDWAALGLALWMTGYLTIFALRLPVTYQHGRYQMPVMPVFFWTGAWGLWRAADWRGRWTPLVISAWRLSLVGILTGFLLAGAMSYGRDVAFIEQNMVETARWVAANLPEDALIAAHDIGALGYFAPRPILDLAGLVSPDVISFIRDEARLAAWLDARGAEFLIVPPGKWYEALPLEQERVYCAPWPTSPMCVYRWR